MKFSFSWLKDYLETDLSADEVGDILTDTGLEVESLIDPRKRLGQLSVGEILKVEKHPNADKLKVCEVYSSTGILKIVCGAPNVKNGMKVVVAKPGDFIPGLNINLKTSKIRDVKSEGMMCSEKELEISDEHDGIIELPSETEVGTLFSELVEDEKIIFERQLDSKIITEIFQVDLYKNNRLQFMFLTNKQLIVLDINGNFVKRIDLKKSESKKYLSVFDYDKNRNYRIVIQNGKSVKMLDSKFNDVKGFKRTKLKTEISHKLKHHRILNKDYLTIVDEDGAPLILDRRGNIRIKLPKNIRTESSNFFINSNSLININNLNQLVRVELNGKISTKQLIDENQKIFADNDNLLVHSNGKLIINNNEFTLPYGNFDGLNILKSKEKTYYHIRSDDDNQSYLFNKMGMVRGFPIFSKSNIDIAFEKNQDLITTKGDDDEVLLYVIN